MIHTFPILEFRCVSVIYFKIEDHYGNYSDVMILIENSCDNYVVFFFF